MAEHDLLNTKVDRILQEEIPEIKVHLATLNAGQERIFDKIESLDKTMVTVANNYSGSDRILIQHEARITSMESSDVDSKKNRDRKIGLAVSVIIPIISAAAGFFFARLK